MAAYFIDIDGTVFYDGTNRPLPNALENLLALVKQGHQVIFTTKRTFPGGAKEVLAAAGLNCPILTSVESPRIIVNDHGAHAVNWRTDEPWPVV